MFCLLKDDLQVAAVVRVVVVVVVAVFVLCLSFLMHSANLDKRRKKPNPCFFMTCISVPNGTSKHVVALELSLVFNLKNIQSV